MREKFPELTLILCADDDFKVESNPGLARATEAARHVNGLLAVPKFDANRPDNKTDFNDMAELYGDESVRKVIEQAILSNNSEDKLLIGNPIDNWPKPQPLIAKLESEPYPLDALPDSIREAVEEVQGFTKAPLPLVISSALAALSLAAQTHADAKRAEKLCGPVSLFFLTIADSGERKSTCDGFFSTAIREYDEVQVTLAKPAIKDHMAANAAWEAKHTGIKEKLRHLAKGGQPTTDLEEALRELEHEKPECPKVPRLIYTDATPEALAFSLAKNWPSGGVVSAEAGIVFGSHSMNKDSIMRNLALLNILWDGGDLTIDRKSTESFTVRNVRLTVGLQVQEATLRNFFDRSGALARGTGFLARFLVAWPESTQGHRLFTDAPACWPALEAFNRRITVILNQPLPINEEGILKPFLLPLSAEAKEAWIVFHNAIEAELVSGGELYDVRDVASKTADNTIRLAALFQLFEGMESGSISKRAIESASRIVAWHLNEARRFFGELALPTEMGNAVRLDSWLISYCRKNGTTIIPRREVQRNVTPAHLRNNPMLDVALNELIEADRIVLLSNGRRKEIHLNPVLLEMEEK
jgi:putative DNA primase/helicase